MILRGETDGVARQSSVMIAECIADELFCPLHAEVLKHLPDILDGADTERFG